MHLEVCASSGSVQQSVFGRTKWPATYIQYFVLGIQLPPALQSPFVSTWSTIMLETKTEKTVGISHKKLLKAHVGMKI